MTSRSTSLDRAVALGCNFFDTAFVYGMGKSEKLLGAMLRRHAGTRLYIATKVPAKNMKWPGSADVPAADTYPYAHILEYTQKSLDNLGTDSVDLQQLHVWSDAWADDEGWQRAAAELKRQKLIRGFGISVNRWEPANVLKALATGLVDSVQVVYNIFDQSPEDQLFPACRALDVAVIARVPFDEGSLTGTLSAESKWPENDWRNIYFTPENLADTLARVDRVKALVPPGWICRSWRFASSWPARMCPRSFPACESPPTWSATSPRATEAPFPRNWSARFALTAGIART